MKEPIYIYMQNNLHNIHIVHITYYILYITTYITCMIIYLYGFFDYVEGKGNSCITQNNTKVKDQNNSESQDSYTTQ